MQYGLMSPIQLTRCPQLRNSYFLMNLVVESTYEIRQGIWRQWRARRCTRTCVEIYMPIQENPEKTVTSWSSIQELLPRTCLVKRRGADVARIRTEPGPIVRVPAKLTCSLPCWPGHTASPLPSGLDGQGENRKPNQWRLSIGRQLKCASYNGDRVTAFVFDGQFAEPRASYSML